MTFDIAVLRDAGSINALAADWDQFVRDDHPQLNGVDGTTCFAWFDALRASFAAAASPAVVTCRQQGLLQGLLPVVPLQSTPWGSTLGLATELYGGRCAPPIAGSTDLVVPALLKGLAEAKLPWSSLQLTLGIESAAADALRSSCRALGWHWTEQPMPPATYFPLAPEGTPLRSCMSTNAWQNLRKAQNQATKLGDRLQMREFSQPETAAELLEAVLTIERDTWKHSAGTAITNSPQQQRFYAELFPRAMRDGQLLALVLYLDGQPIAHHFGLQRDGVFCCLKHSHVQSQDALSPSNLVMAELLQLLPQRGVRTFDWMGLVEPHKLRWSQNNAYYQRSTFVVYAPSWRGQAAWSALRAKALVKRWHQKFRPGPAEAATTGGNSKLPAATESLEVIAPGPKLAALASPWDALVRESPVDLVGMDATSSYCWFEALAASRPQAAASLVLAKRRGQVLLGVLPLVRAAQGLTGSRLKVATELYGGRNGLLLQSPSVDDVVELLNGLPMAFPDWVTLECSFVRDSESLELMREAAKKVQFECHEEALAPTPYVALLDSAERFDAGVSRKVQRNMRSSLRLAATRGQVNFREFRDPADADALLDVILDVERRSWKHEAGTAITRRPDQEAFYRALAAPAMQQGLLYALVLYLDDVPISYQLGLLRSSVYSCLKNSMCQANADLRPSYLIKAELFNRLRALGVQTVDLMGVAEPHKMVWAEQTPTYERVRLTLYRSNINGRTLALSRQLKAHFVARNQPLAEHTDTAPLQ